MYNNDNDSNSISAFEAKNRLGALLDRVEDGEELTITRHGVPVAVLVPIAKMKRKAVELILQSCSELRNSLKKNKVVFTQEELQQMKRDGQK